jgi:hypothetical protein
MVLSRISWLFLSALIVYTMVLCSCPLSRKGTMRLQICRVRRNGTSSGRGKNCGKKT